MPKNSAYASQCSATIAGSVDGSSSGRSSGNSMMGGVSQSATAALFQSVAVVGGVTNQRHALRSRFCDPTIRGSYPSTPIGKRHCVGICPRRLERDDFGGTRSSRVAIGLVESASRIPRYAPWIRPAGLHVGRCSILSQDRVTAGDGHPRRSGGRDRCGLGTWCRRVAGSVRPSRLS